MLGEGPLRYQSGVLERRSRAEIKKGVQRARNVPGSNDQKSLEKEGVSSSRLESRKAAGSSSRLGALCTEESDSSVYAKCAELPIMVAVWIFAQLSGSHSC